MMHLLRLNVPANINSEKYRKTGGKTVAGKPAAKDDHGETESIYVILIKRFLYYAMVLLIVITAFKMYFLWLDAYRYSHPAVYQVESGGYSEEIPFKGVLLWEENLIHATTSGVVSYTSLQPRRVRKGELLCRINGSAINSSEAGYFIPALDGYEENWNYSDLWLEASSLPSPTRAVYIPNETYVNKDQPIGKLIPQPQELRAIAWIDITPSLKQDLDRNRIRIKRSENDWGLWAEVRTMSIVSQKAKIYVTLPFFTPDMTEMRSFSWFINVGDRNGIYVSNSSVIFRDGVMGVYVVKGNKAIFKEVEAFHADEDNFFVTSGVIPGDILILDASKAREGQVNVW